MKIVGIGLTVAALIAAGALRDSPGQPAATQGTSEAAYRANNSGVAALERFDYRAAASVFRDAIRIDPSVAIARLNLAIALYYDGQPDAALTEAQVATKALPREPRAWFVTGLAARAAANDAAASEAFEQVIALDPDDAASLVNLGQLDLENARYLEALARFSKAVALEPFNATAAYGLGTALIRARRAAEAQTAMAKFQVLRDAPDAITYGNGYLEQGRYGEALVSVGTEAPLVDRTMPATTFTDITSEIAARAGSDPIRWASLVDLDHQEPLEVLLGNDAAMRVLRPSPTAWIAGPLIETGGSVGVAAADFDNDGRIDLCVLSNRGLTLWRQVAPDRFDNVTVSAQLSLAPAGRAIAWADLDHDGDLDLVVAGAQAGQAWRNNGNGTFSSFAETTGLAIPAGIESVVATDFDARRDIDLVGAGPAGSVLFKNLRQGRFENVSTSVGLPSDAVSAIATADLNADGRPDFFFAGAAGASSVLMSRGASGFASARSPESSETRAAQFADYDGDGVLDLVTYGAAGLRIHRSTGDGWVDVSAAAKIGAEPCDGGCALVAGDMDADGDIDLLTSSQRGIHIWRNDGPVGLSVSVDLGARVSNRSAVGSKIDVRAGSLLRRLETTSAWPPVTPIGAVVGLGRRRAEVVRVIWPSGIVQSEGAPSAAGGLQRSVVMELDRKPSSCPFLFTWNGDRFEFVTDFLGGGETGAWARPGEKVVPDPEEYVRIRGDQLRERDGKYELRVTNELEEVLFLDRLSLIAVTHPEGTDVYPNEGLTAAPYSAHRLFVTQRAAPPETVLDEHGHDVRALVSRRDRRAPSDFSLQQFRGYASEHYLDFEVPAPHLRPLRLLLTGWTDYAFSSDNLAASQSGLSLRPPSLELLRDGRWQTIVDNVGIPIGRPQTIVVDLEGRLPPGEARLRLRTNMPIHWDEVLIAQSSDGDVQQNRIEMDRGALAWRGYSAEVSPDGREPFGYDNTRVVPDAPWKLMPGRYTREGDVKVLMTAVDDQFVVARPGDQIILSFPALPPLPTGRTRTFLLHADGFSKEMDVNSASPDIAAPLPFHGMLDYPTDAARRRPSAAVRDYINRYNTRMVRRAVPLLLGASEHR